MLYEECCEVLIRDVSQTQQFIFYLRPLHFNFTFVVKFVPNFNKGIIVGRFFWTASADTKPQSQRPAEVCTE